MELLYVSLLKLLLCYHKNNSIELGQNHFIIYNTMQQFADYLRFIYIGIIVHFY